MSEHKPTLKEVGLVFVLGEGRGGGGGQNHMSRVLSIEYESSMIK